MRETSEGNLPEGIRPVRADEVAIVLVEKDGKQTIARKMPLNERGELVKAWPGGFFEEGLREVF
jgi:predicted ATPase